MVLRFRRPPRSTRAYSLVPYTTLSRSGVAVVHRAAVAGVVAELLGDQQALHRVQESEGDDQHGQRPQQDVDPPGRLEGELDPEHQRHEEGAEEEDDEHGRPVAGVLLPEVQAADVAALGRSEEHTSELQSLMRISY